MVLPSNIVWISSAVLLGVVLLVLFYLWYKQRPDAVHGSRIRQQVVRNLKAMGCKLRGDDKVHCKVNGGLKGLGDKFTLEAAVTKAVNNFCSLMKKSIPGEEEEEEDDDVVMPDSTVASQQQQPGYYGQYDTQNMGAVDGFGRPTVPTVSAPQYVPGASPQMPPGPSPYPMPVPHYPIVPQQQQMMMMGTTGMPPQAAPMPMMMPQQNAMPTPNAGYNPMPQQQQQQQQQGGFAPGVFSVLDANGATTTGGQATGGFASDLGSGDAPKPLPFEPIRTKGGGASSNNIGSTSLNYNPKVY